MQQSKSRSDRADREAVGAAGLGEGSSQAYNVISGLKQAKGVPMNIEIIDEPIRFHLHGIEGVVEQERFARSVCV